MAKEKTSTTKNHEQEKSKEKVSGKRFPIKRKILNQKNGILNI